MTRLQAGRARKLDLIPSKDKRFFSSPKYSDQLWGSPSLLYKKSNATLAQKYSSSAPITTVLLSITSGVDKAALCCWCLQAIEFIRYSVDVTGI
jgi:hypothetical protein